MSKFYDYIRFSNIAIAIGNTNYLTYNRLYYDKVSYKKYFFIILILNRNNLIN